MTPLINWIGNSIGAGSSSEWTSSDLGDKMLFDFNVPLTEFVTHSLGGANIGVLVDSSGKRTLGSNLLSGSWTFENMDGGSASADEATFSGVNTDTGLRAKAVSPVFSMTAGKCYEIEFDLVLTEVTLDWDLYLVSASTSNAADSIKVRFDTTGTYHVKTHVVCTETDATSHVIFNQHGSNLCSVDFSVTNFTIKEWATGYYASSPNTTAYPSLGDGVNLKTNGTDEYMDMNHHLAAFKALSKGCLIVKYNESDIAQPKMFMGVGDSSSNNDHMIIQQKADAELGIYKMVGGVDESTTYTNAVEGLDDNILIIQTNGVDSRLCRFNGVEKSVAGSTNFNFFDDIILADEVILFGRTPQLTSVFSDIEITRMIFCDDVLSASEINDIENNL